MTKAAIRAKGRSGARGEETVRFRPLALGLAKICYFLLLAFPGYAQIHIACGLPSGTQSITDSSGTVWNSDANYTSSGSLWTVSPAPTNPVYQHLRYSAAPLIYKIPVSNGNYQLTLKFIEPNLTTPGGRAFSVLANGTPAVSTLDLVAIAGNLTPFDVTVPISITNSTLYLQLTTQVRNAVISGIDIEPTPASAKISCPTPQSCQGIVMTSNPDGSVAIAANTAFLLSKDTDEQFQCHILNSSNGTSAYTATLGPQCLALQRMTPGMAFLLHPDVSNATGPATLNIDGQGTHAIKQPDRTTDPAPNSIAAGGYYWIVFDGSVWFRL